MSFRGFLLISAAASFGAISPICAQVITTAPTSFTNAYTFPPVGLGSSETASITVVNTATTTPLEETNTTPVAAPSCTGTISFSNAAGAIGTPASFTLGLEEFKTFTLPFVSAGLTGNRGEIQGKVSLTSATATRTSCSLMFSLETYDSTTGATHVVLSNSLAILGPILPFFSVPGH
jgi:hypothetical protein